VISGGLGNLGLKQTSGRMLIARSLLSSYSCIPNLVVELNHYFEGGWGHSNVISERLKASTLVIMFNVTMFYFFNYIYIYNIFLTKIEYNDYLVPSSKTMF
jgi:hypothetical protein